MVLEVLAWRVLGYDDDGIDLYFTNPNTETSVKGLRKSIPDFVTAMGEARPSPLGPQGQGYVKTNPYHELDKIMPKAINLQGKSKTVIILTDGLWEGIPYEEYVDRYIKETLCRLAGQDPTTLHRSPRPGPAGKGAESDDWRDYLEKIRPITLQFIAFGYKGDKGWARMERLDDMLDGLP